MRLHARGKVLTFARREGDAISVPAGPTHDLVADYASLPSAPSTSTSAR